MLRPPPGSERIGGLGHSGRDPDAAHRGSDRGSARFKRVSAEGHEGIPPARNGRLAGNNSHRPCAGQPALHAPCAGVARAGGRTASDDAGSSPISSRC